MNRLIAFLALFLVAVLTSCSPYMKQMKQLDSDYQAGLLTPAQYYQWKGQLIGADQQWRANMAAGMMAASSAINQQNALLQQQYQNQQMINAYNARTMSMILPRPQPIPMPQQVNVNGTINVNQNVSGTLYLKGY